MYQISINNDFSSWRLAARTLLSDGVKPHEILWTGVEQNSLFSPFNQGKAPASSSGVPQSFISLAEAVSCHTDPSRWGLLYTLLFRLVNESRDLFHIESDPDVRQARLMEKAVNRDVHKFHAFVRFRRLEFEGEEIFTAWHEPQHYTVERAAPFFMRRFGEMRFSILTPNGCAHWNKKELLFSELVDRSKAPKPDELEEYWLLYYRSIFNPFRLKVGTMKKELPVRHWATLPEAVLIPELVRQATEPASFSVPNKQLSPRSNLTRRPRGR